MIKPELEQYIATLDAEVEKISAARILLLREVAKYLVSSLAQRREVLLNFICTHNSRRSHISQIWAATMAYYFDVPGVKTFSGGTEVTAMNVRVVNALLKTGFTVVNPDTGGVSNPKYEVGFSPEVPSLICYSKKFGDPENPGADFAALLTCSDVDEVCPMVPGAERRFALHYEDPKEADDTPWEAERYEERVRQIGGEMYFLMDLVAEKVHASS